MTEMEDLRDRVKAFAAAREWDRFHSPKNLAMALTVEVSELLEIFQWLSEDESRALPPAAQAAAWEEIGDVLIYFVRLADQLGIDPVEAARRKLVVNGQKYPVEKARGNNKKYTEL